MGNTEKNLHIGGIPTGPDVKNIRDKFPDSKLKAGNKIGYAQIEAIIKTQRDEPRFRTVTNAWRRAVRRDANKIIGVIAGSGFVVLDENEKSNLVGRKIRRSVKQLRSGYKVMQTIDVAQLGEDEKKSYDFNAMRMGKMIAMARLKPQSVLPTMENKED